MHGPPSLCVSCSSGRSLTSTQIHRVFSITYHYVGTEVKIMLPIKVMWLSLAHHRASIYISSYICFECHWAEPWNSTLNPTGNVHDSFLLPATLTIPEMTSLISLSCRLVFNQGPVWIHLFFLNVLLYDSLFTLLAPQQYALDKIRPIVQGNGFQMLPIYNNIQRLTPAFTLTFAAPSPSVLLCVELHLAVIFRFWARLPLRTKHTSRCWRWEDTRRKMERNWRKNESNNQIIVWFN